MRDQCYHGYGLNQRYPVSNHHTISLMRLFFHRPFLFFFFSLWPPMQIPPTPTNPWSRKNIFSTTPCPVLVSLVSLFIGLGGISFAINTIIRPPLPVFPCGISLYTFRQFYPPSDNGAVTHRPKLLGFVGIQTGFDSGDRRALEQAIVLAFRFVIGRTKDAKKMARLQKEIYQSRDFMLIDIEEQCLKLPFKTLPAFRIKADDDIYLRSDRLAKERPHLLKYIGCMKKGPVITALNLSDVLSAQAMASLASARNNRNPNLGKVGNLTMDANRDEVRMNPLWQA
ncbi:hypothetical protein Pint_12960 [Pistacia integerrima]|uniref:Uncharacterized protein n=1 Tax=Pistacia integerrima TaxID=434235 RepID=A0ACC0Y923_9ROSI|nr:hypothetical protein Pint_12960 [Pistacia integerrima]